ncbi:MAG: hypothetical protein BWY52_00441 [Chloroflexi bacterium ADurb.Bin325]|nr:MAG: hypothetical protein BWY52_00441 [Chloroflexi bacterium ADurb.Bin325]
MTETPSGIQAEQRNELMALLQARSVADLRSIARAWGWPLKGTAKNDLAQQLTNHLTDAPRMRAVYDRLSPTEAALLQWHNILAHTAEPTGLVAALSYVTQRQISTAEYSKALETLQERGLLFTTLAQALAAPAVFSVWLPPLTLPWLRPKEPPAARPTFSIRDLNTTVYQLISRIESEHPLAARSASSMAAANLGSAIRPFTARPGLLSRDTLVAWGYATQPDRNIARFFLEQLVLGQIIKIAGAAPNARLTVDEAARTRWEMTPPDQRVMHLRAWWIGGRRPDYRTTALWNELDLAIAAVTGGYTLRHNLPWADTFTASTPIDRLRQWLAGLLLRLDSAWLEFEGFIQLIRHLRPALLTTEEVGKWQWYRDGRVLEPTTMDWETWRTTNGRLVEAFLTGPAQWLGLVEISYQGQRPTAFRVQSELPAEEFHLPTDMLQFAPPDTLVLKNVWQAGALHALLRELAVEERRGRERVHYRLNAPVFRDSLMRGLTLDALIARFAAAGASLPAEAIARLRDWEQRAGNFRLHEGVGVIEFGADMTPEEVQAIVRIGGDWLYQVAPRCLVALDAERVPELLVNLRQRGYTPQVIS